MLKKIISLALIGLFFTSCKTMYHGEDAAQSDLTYVSVLDFEESQNDLYIKANQWAVETFNSAESVIQFSDKDAGIIMGKYTSDIKVGVYNGMSKSTIKIELKDKKVRLTFLDPYVKVTHDDLGTRYNDDFIPAKKKNVIEQMRLEWMAMETNFKDYMSVNSDW